MEDHSIISQEDMDDHSIISQEDMDDHFILSQEDMEDYSVFSQEDNKIKPEDEIIISYYLNMMINNRKSWPSHFLRDEEANVYNMNPWSFFNTHNPNHFFFVKRRTEACGKSDSGCWRIMRRDRVIISKRNKVVGFKFCVKEEKTEPVYKFWGDDKYKVNECKVTWVMDEYRLAKKKEQGQVICRISLLFPSPLKCHFRYF